MRTLKELAEMIEKYEAEQAPGSETGLLSNFVTEYGTKDTCKYERAGETVSDDEYNAWERAYQLQAQFEESGRDYDSGNLF